MDECSSIPEDGPAELRAANEDEAIAGFVIGAKRFGRPELLREVPSPPTGAPKCAICTGKRWVRVSTEQGGHEILCPQCGGRGWTSEKPEVR